MENSKETKTINVYEIPLELIDPNPQNKEIFVVSELDGLINSIKEHGFMGAIEVYSKPDGRYQISAGHRRYNSMKLLKEKTIPCIVKEMEDESTVTKKLIESNINIRVLSPIELSRSILAYEKALNEEGYRGSVNAKLTEVFSITENKLLRLKSISKLTESLQKYAYTIDFPYESFYDATYFPQDRQKELYELLNDHFKRFPDAEISKSLVNQFIQQIKLEIKLEKEKTERDKILEKYTNEQQTVVEPVKKIKEQYSERIIPPLDEDVSFISYKNIYQDNTKPKIIEYTESQLTVPETEDTNERTVSSFEIELYIDRIKKLTDIGTIKISKENKKKIVTELESIIEKINKAEII